LFWLREQYQTHVYHGSHWVSFIGGGNSSARIYTYQCSGFLPEPPEFWPIYQARTNPLEIYDDVLYFFNVSFYRIPGIYYVCNFLPCPIFVPRSYRRGILCLQNNFFSSRTPPTIQLFLYICPIWLILYLLILGNFALTFQ
jgi:hypothetical protein